MQGLPARWAINRGGGKLPGFHLRGVPSPGIGSCGRANLTTALHTSDRRSGMAANPALVQTYQGALCPAPFANEVFVLSRPKVGFELDGVQTAKGR
jgi:hypothetical protein